MTVRKERPCLKDLPGWEKAYRAALTAKQLMPAGHGISYISPSTMTTVGNFVAPESIRQVTVHMLLCMAIGIESLRYHEARARQEAKRAAKRGNVIDLAAWRINKSWVRSYDYGDPSTWRPKGNSLGVDAPCEIEKCVAATKEDESELLAAVTEAEKGGAVHPGGAS